MKSTKTYLIRLACISLVGALLYFYSVPYPGNGLRPYSGEESKLSNFTSINIDVNLKKFQHEIDLFKIDESQIRNSLTESCIDIFKDSSRLKNIEITQIGNIDTFETAPLSLKIFFSIQAIETKKSVADIKYNILRTRVAAEYAADRVFGRGQRNSWKTWPKKEIIAPTASKDLPSTRISYLVPTDKKIFLKEVTDIVKSYCSELSKDMAPNLEGSKSFEQDVIAVLKK